MASSRVLSPTRQTLRSQNSSRAQRHRTPHPTPPLPTKSFLSLCLNPTRDREPTTAQEPSSLFGYLDNTDD